MRSTASGSGVRRWLRAASIVGAAVAALSCSDRPPVAPKAIEPGHSRLSLRPTFQRAAAGGPTVDLKSVVATLTGPNGESIVVHADFEGDIATLVFDVPLSGAATTFNLDVTAFDAQGQPAYHTSGPVTLKPGENTPAAPTLVYAAADAALQVLHVAPGTAVLSAGATQSLGVTGTGPNNAPITSIRVGWTSKDATIATVDANGLVKAGVLQGSTYIVARTVLNVADSARITVHGNVAKVTVAPATLTLARGVSGAVGAELRDAANTLIDDRSATWSSSDPSIATVSATGVVQAVATGTATITATAEGKTASAAVTVVSPLDHIEFSPAGLTFASLGETQTITARLVPVTGASVDGITATLSTSDASVATVDASGVVTAKSNGTATITASADGKQATAAVTVRQQAATLSISPTFAGVTSLGDSRTFTATAADARGNAMAAAGLTWSSSDAGVATVTNGVATGKSAGSTTITVSSGDKQAGATFTVAQVPAAVALTADRTTIQVGATTQLHARITDANGNAIANAAAGYQSANTNIATVSATGRVTAVSAGDATMSAGSGPLTATLVIHVTAIQGGPPQTGGGASGQVIDGVTSVGIAGASVTPSSGTATTTLSDGTFDLANVPSGASLVVAAAGYVSTTYFNAQTGTGGALQVGSIPLAPTSTSQGTVSGRVIDASVGGFAGISSATVSIRSGINALTGTVVASPSVDAGGNFTAQLAAGTYTISATASGFSRNSVTSVVVGGSTQFNQNVSLVPGTGLRITLTWGQNPRDLDSHLFGPDANGGRFHTWYGGRFGPDGETLDNDITGGFGPENTTVPNPLTGTYNFYVQHYSGTSSMATSGAQVTVTLNGVVLGTFHPPARPNEQSGDIWKVFSLTGSTITPINTFVSGFSGNVPEAIRRASIAVSTQEQADIRAIQSSSTKPKSP